MSVQLDTLEEDQSSFHSTSNSNDPRKTHSDQEIKISRAMIKGVLVFLALHVFRIITIFGELYIMLDQNKDDQAKIDESTTAVKEESAVIKEENS